MEASYKYASPIFCAWESMFISKVTVELMRMCDEGLPVYVVGNMHDGVLVLHRTTLKTEMIETRINKVLEDYSKISLGLALKVSVKREAE